MYKYIRHQFIIEFSIIGILALFFLFAPSSVFGADCAGVPVGNSDYTVSTSCTFAGTVDGIDNGNLIIATDQTLTINAGQTIVWNSGFSITINSNAEIAIAVGATGLKKTNLWMVDGDNDGYPLNTTQTAQDGDPGGGSRRRKDLTSHTTVDTNDGDGTCYRGRYLISEGTITDCVADITTCVADSDENYQDTPAAFFTVFISSDTRQGGFDSPGTVDGQCDTLAGNATPAVSGSFTAWVSENTDEEPQDRGLSACETAGAGSVAWYLTDGTKVADDWDDLVDRSIDAAINKDESNSSVTNNTWTGTQSNGIADAGTDCNNWGSSASNKDGTSGDYSATDGNWTDTADVTCDNSYAIYCFQHAQ